MDIFWSEKVASEAGDLCLIELWCLFNGEKCDRIS
jgi:hypothetical protein